MDKAILEKFRNYENALARWAPTMLDDANNLAARQVDARAISPNLLWRLIWDKPLYANSSVTAADNRVRNIEFLFAELPSTKNSWINDFSVEFNLVERGQKRAHWTDHRNYKFSGKTSKQLSTEFSILGRRLRAIHGAGKAFVRWHGRLPTRFFKLSRQQQIFAIRRSFGAGWGPISAAHLLTDLGLAVKPDIHLVATAQAIGLIEIKNYQFGMPFSDSRLIEIIDRVVDLNEALNPNSSSMTLVKSLRRLDKVLMEISRQKILPKEFQGADKPHRTGRRRIINVSC